MSCSIYLYLSRQKSSEKNYSLYNQTARLVTLPKEGSKLKNIFPSDKIGFYHTVFLFFCFTRNELIKWIPGVNLYGPKIKKGTISRVARGGNTHLFGLGGYVSLGYNVFWVLSLKKGPPAPLPMASLSAPSPRTIYILIHLSEILNNQQFFKFFVKDTFTIWRPSHITKLILSLFNCCRCCCYSCVRFFRDNIYFGRVW